MLAREGRAAKIVIEHRQPVHNEHLRDMGPLIWLEHDEQERVTLLEKHRSRQDCWTACDSPNIGLARGGRRQFRITIRSCTRKTTRLSRQKTIVFPLIIEKDACQKIEELDISIPSKVAPGRGVSTIRKACLLSTGKYFRTSAHKAARHNTETDVPCVGFPGKLIPTVPKVSTGNTQGRAYFNSQYRNGCSAIALGSVLGQQSPKTSPDTSVREHKVVLVTDLSNWFV